MRLVPSREPVVELGDRPPPERRAEGPEGPSALGDRHAEQRLASLADLGPLGYCRENPVEALFLSRRRLNDPGGEKETWHIEIGLDGTPIQYEVGDSLGLFPANAPALVDAVIAELGARPERVIGEKTLREHLLMNYALGAAPDNLVEEAKKIVTQ